MEYFGLNSSQVVNGRIRTFDGSSRWRTMAYLGSGLSAKDLVRFGQLLWRVKQDETAGYLGTESSLRLSERYDAEPVSRYFSPAFCERIIRPMTVRMNGAEPGEIYMGTLLSNVRMILDSYEQFTHGLAPLLNACLGAYDVRLNTSVQELLVEGNRVTGVRVSDVHGVTELRGAGVIIATPAPAAAALTAPVLPALADRLRSVAYYPVTLVLAEYDRPIFSPSVRAIVFDRWHALSNAGAYGINDLNLVRYTFSGRTSRRVTDAMDIEALLHGAESTLSRYVAIDRGWRRGVVARRFNPGLCAYTPHHATFLRQITAETQQLTGLHLTGDYLQGASIEACFRAASACVQRLATRHHSPLERCDSRIVA
jgi:oxygen-dependent protoporphyrinogen oxidase